jgi:RNA polymerase sigma-70 factor (ECF subfamily)
VNTPDWPVLQDFIDGNDSAFIQIYEAYKVPLHRFCCRMVRNEQESQDIVQDVFTMLYKNPPYQDRNARLKSWLFTVARNGCLKSLRRSKFTEDEDLSMMVSQEQPDDETECAERTLVLQRVLSQLSPEYREAVILREWNGMSYEEISEILQTSIPAIKSRLFKARKQISTILHATYGEECHEL